jgi:sulfur-oxidizing protein SoxY
MKPVTKGPAARREFLLAAGGLAAGIAFESAGAAAAAPPAAAKSTASVAATLEAIRRVAGSATINKGKVKLELPELVDNGNAVPLTVRVDSPTSATDYVRAIHIFTQKNPLPDVAAFRLGPRAGRATVSTRVRLADTQTVIAIAQMSDGSFWSGTADVVVTLAACLEEL